MADSSTNTGQAPAQPPGQEVAEWSKIKKCSKMQMAMFVSGITQYWGGRTVLRTLQLVTLLKRFNLTQPLFIRYLP